MISFAIYKKREVIFHIYDAIRITLVMMTLEYLGRLISSRPGHKTVRAFISMKTLRATNTLQCIIVCMQKDLSHVLSVSGFMYSCRGWMRDAHSRAHCITSQEVNLDAATPYFIEINKFSFSTYKKLSALLSGLYLNNHHFLRDFSIWGPASTLEGHGSLCVFFAISARSVQKSWILSQPKPGQTPRPL